MEKEREREETNITSTSVNWISGGLMGKKKDRTSFLKKKKQ